MTGNEFDIALATLPEAATLSGARLGACWASHCNHRAFWPAEASTRAIVRCDSEFNPHVGIVSPL